MSERIVERYNEARKELHKIEAYRHIKVLHACESGSRAWGFASPNSDYDVRFIYVRPMSSYLGLHARRDVIDREDLGEPKNDLDFSGWDILKTLELAGKSNPQIIEWLDSPIQYYQHKPFTDELKDIVSEFNPKALMHHYASMAHNQVKNYIAKTGEQIIFKKYLYALRPIYCVLALEANPFEVPPVLFDRLWESVKHRNPVLRSQEFRDEQAELLRMKAAKNEEAKQLRMPLIEEFIQAMSVTTREMALNGFDGRTPDMMRLEDLSRRMIREFQ